MLLFMREKESRATLFSRVLLAYMTLLILVVTLAPFQLEIPERPGIRFHSSLFNLLSNVALFVPLGYLFQLGRSRRESLLGAFFFGALVSLTIETVQLFVEGRVTSAVDFVANAVGAAVGAFLLQRLYSPVHQGQAFRVLALQLPLTQVLYLVIPLMWLSGLSLGGEPRRIILFALLSLFGAGILTSIYRNRLSQFSRLNYTVVLLAWFVMGAAPAAARFPLLIALLAVILAALSLLITRLPWIGGASDRRFEVPTLKWLSPLYLGYLALLCSWPSQLSFDLWNRAIRSEGNRLLLTFRLLEILIAFTLLGYLIAEFRSRKEDSLLKISVLVLAVSTLFVSIGALIGGHQLSSTGNLAELLLILLAAWLGALGFRLQLRALKAPGTPGKTISAS